MAREKIWYATNQEQAFKKVLGLKTKYPHMVGWERKRINGKRHKVKITAHYLMPQYP
jgi:hypothetical protein